MRAVGKLRSERVVAWCELDLGFRLGFAEVHVLLSEGDGFARRDGIQVDQQVVVATVGHNVARRLDLQTRCAKFHHERGAHGRAIGGCQDANGLRRRRRRAGAASGQQRSGGNSCDHAEAASGGGEERKVVHKNSPIRGKAYRFGHAKRA